MLFRSIALAAFLISVPAATAQPRAHRMVPVLAHGRARIFYDSFGPFWTIGNDVVTLSLGLGPDGTLRMFELATPTAEAVRLDAGPDTFLTIEDEVQPLGLKTGFAFIGYDVVERPDGVELAINFQLRSRGLFATRHYAIYPTAPVVEIWTSLESSAQESQIGRAHV